MKELIKKEEVIPHCTHALIGVAVVTLASLILHKLCKIHEGLKEIRKGHEEIVEGRKKL